MDRLSIFDIYKIGIGPSSSHTLGPWKAANDFARRIGNDCPDKIQIHLFGSLSKTGIGHATDIAVQMGLQGFDPTSFPVDKIEATIQNILEQRTLTVNNHSISFDPNMDIIFEPSSDPRHPNTLIFKAFKGSTLILDNCYFSVGGGFIEHEEDDPGQMRSVQLPFPIDSAVDLENHTANSGNSIAQIVFENEKCFQDSNAVFEQVDDIFHTMLASVYRGCCQDGILPGGLNVKRRAKRICQQLLEGADYESPEEWMELIRNSSPNFSSVTRWVSCFALAVNEENAAMGRIVTSPTNGAAGVIPAVLLYHYFFGDYKGVQDIRNFLFTSGEIGCIFKKKATISAAVGGCQAEIGVSSSMAAAGLTEVMGGSPQQVLMAAEIAMEHHLGLTCDPVGGLVQIPCIERNSMGAMKAITACKLALSSDPKDAIVNFDLVVKAMWDTAQEMNHKYKETSEGGLAFNLPVAFPNC